MPGRPPAAEVKRRVRALRDLSSRLRAAFLDRLAGSTLEVVVERPAGSAPGVVGTSAEYARVLIGDGTPDLVGRVVLAVADRRDGDRLSATLVRFQPLVGPD